MNAKLIERDIILHIDIKNAEELDASRDGLHGKTWDDIQDDVPVWLNTGELDQEEQQNAYVYASLYDYTASLLSIIPGLVSDRLGLTKNTAGSHLRAPALDEIDFNGSLISLIQEWVQLLKVLWVEKPGNEAFQSQLQNSQIPYDDEDKRPEFRQSRHFSHEEEHTETELTSTTADSHNYNNHTTKVNTPSNKQLSNTTNLYLRGNQPCLQSSLKHPVF